MKKLLVLLALMCVGAASAHEPCTAPAPEPDPAPDFSNCQIYESGYFCANPVSGVDPAVWESYEGFLNGGFLGFVYYPVGACPILTPGVTLVPECGVDPTPVPDPDPVPDPVPPPSGEIARGVPNPTPALGFNPFTFNPAITSTVANVPSVVSAGQSILVTGGNTPTQVQFNCTAAAPCMLKSNGSVRTQPLGVTGSYFVLDGFVFQGDNTESVWAGQGASNYVIRNVTHTGNNTRTSNGTSMLHTGGDNVVFYNNTIHNLAVADGSSEVDYMAFNVSRGSNIWVLGNTSYQVGGDSLKLGQNVARAGGQFPSTIYVAGNNFGDNGENPIDIKWAIDVVVADNDLHDSESSVSSSGECTVIHESGDNIRFYDNRLTRCTVGIETATSGGGASYIEVDGNLFTDVRLGVYNRGGGHADVTNNVFIRNEQMWAVNTNNGSTVTASGNVEQ